jgi:CRISPR-associated endoribonuclease Cas6
MQYTQHNELKYLRFSRFIFVARAETELLLPRYKGSAFRGGFGHNLRRTVCINRREDCGGCILQSRCIYCYVFETKPPADSSLKTYFADVPHPYILVPPDIEKSFFRPEERFRFELILVGKAIDYLPYFLFVFMQVGENGVGKDRGRFYIESVFNERFGEEVEIYSHESGSLSGNIQIYTSESFFPLYREMIAADPEQITIRLLTPLRIKIAGHLSDDFTFFDLFRSLLNRLYMLTYFHCGNRFERDHKELLAMSREIEIVEKNLYWQDWERYSSRQKTRMKMGGVRGEFTIRGGLIPFLPFLKIGEYIHIGKATTMGLGRYEILPPPESGTYQ